MSTSGATKSPSGEIPLGVSGRWRPLLRVPGIEGYGTWRTFTWDNKGAEQHGAHVRADEAPWKGLFRALDEAGTAFADAPVSLEDEADAALAYCWRYGSYVHLLTGGEYFPAFRTDPDLSRIGDSEMRRINIEFSAALAEWLATREHDPTLFARRVRTALDLLPRPWRRRRPPWWEEGVRARGRRRAGALQDAMRQVGDDPFAELPLASDDAALVRQEANGAVLWCYRNGPIEDLHAGTWSHGSDVPGFVRLYASELDRLCEETAARLGVYLVMRDVLAKDARRLIAAAGAPRDWTLTEQTAHVAYFGMPGTGPLEPRLRYLARRYPEHFGGRIEPGAYDLRHDRPVEPHG